MLKRRAVLFSHLYYQRRPHAGFPPTVCRTLSPAGGEAPGRVPRFPLQGFPPKGAGPGLQEPNTARMSGICSLVC